MQLQNAYKCQFLSFPYGNNLALGYYTSSQKNVLRYYPFEGFHSVITRFNEEAFSRSFLTALKDPMTFIEMTSVAFYMKEFTLIYFQNNWVSLFCCGR